MERYLQSPVSRVLDLAWEQEMKACSLVLKGPPVPPFLQSKEIKTHPFQTPLAMGPTLQEIPFYMAVAQL